MAKKTTAPPPAYFLSLSLENVRSFGEKQTIYFTDGGKDWKEGGKAAQWTVILGDNGVGKTTVLKSLAALRPTVDKNLKVLYVPSFLSHWPFEWRPSRSSQQRETYIEYAAEHGLKLIDVGRNKDITNPIIDRITVVPNTVRHTSNSSSSGQTSGPIISGLICYGYGAGRTTGNSTLSEAPENIDTCVSLFDDRADLLNPEEWFLQTDYNSRLTAGGGPFARHRELMEGVLLKVLPDIDALRIVSSGTPQKPAIALQLLTPYGWVRLRDMSLGYQTLVVWLTDFASKLFIRYPESKNPLEEPAIVLIDEIDLHLHPSWQRRLIGFLSGIFKNTQFIATAHSPLVVQAAGDAGANIVLLKREGDQTVVHQNPEDVRGWRIDQILNSELFEDTSSLSPQTEDDLQRRNKLLLKKRLTAKEKAELEQLAAKLNAQPVGDTKPERRVENLLARLARNLKEEDLLK